MGYLSFFYVEQWGPQWGQGEGGADGQQSGIFFFLRDHIGNDIKNGGGEFDF